MQGWGGQMGMPIRRMLSTAVARTDLFGEWMSGSALSGSVEWIKEVYACVFEIIYVSRHNCQSVAMGGGGKLAVG